MPVIARYSAELDKKYEEDKLLSRNQNGVVANANSTGNGSGLDGSRRNGSGSSASETNRSAVVSPTLREGDGERSPSSAASIISDGRSVSCEDRSPNGSIASHGRTSSTDSLDSASGSSYGAHSRQLSNDSSKSADYIPTRSIKQAVKPNHNPLQFVKVAQSPLSQKAAAQMKKSEEVKKLRPIKQDEEEWQSNLDNWKSKRRQISHKTVERAEELRKLEEEEYDRKRRKSKTFNEMMEERTKRGMGRKLSYFTSDDELEEAELEDPESETSNGCNGDSSNIKRNLSMDSTESDSVFHGNNDHNISHLISNNSHDGSSKEKSVDSGYKSNGKYDSPMSPSPANGCENGSKDGSVDNAEEYTFEKAIQSYVQYAESHTKGPLRDKIRSESKIPKSETPLIPSPTKSKASVFADFDDTTDDSTSKHTDVKNDLESAIQRTGGTAMNMVVTIKPGTEHRDFGFTTRGQGRGMVFVDKIAPRGNADYAGLKANDEILSINGEGICNRNHSAIVFAIKQAVYTGQLELGLYRYHDAKTTLLLGQSETINFLPKNKKPSQVEERKAVFSRDQTQERAVTPERRTFSQGQKPKVDLGKRRSLFENPSKNVNANAVNQPRNSLDGSSTALSPASKITPLQNFDGDRGRKSIKPDRDNGFSQKLQNFKNRENNGSDNRRPAYGRSVSYDKHRGATPDSNKSVMQRLSSMDNVKSENLPSNEHNNVQERSDNLKERIASYEKREALERSRSCELLDISYSEDKAPEQKKQTIEIKTKLSFGQSQDDTVDSAPLQSVNSGASSTSSTPSPTKTVQALNENIRSDNRKSTGAPQIVSVKPKDPEPPELELSADMPLQIPASPMTPTSPEPKPIVESLVATPSPDAEVAHQEIPLSPKPIFVPVEEEIVKKIQAPLSETTSTNIESTIMPRTPSPTEQPNGPITMSGELQTPGHVAHPSKPILQQVPNHRTEPAPDDKGKQDAAPKQSPEDQVVHNSPRINPLGLSNLGDEVIFVDDFDFDAPPRMVEPPKEKPPPPPVEDSEQPLTSKLKRLDSTKRIKKELYRRRSEYLGIDLSKTPDLEPKLNGVPPPPDMEDILRAERALDEQQRRELQSRQQNPLLLPLWDQSPSEFSSDSNPMSVDSNPLSIDSNPMSMDSNPTSIDGRLSPKTTDEDDIARKEQEIIENLEREEQQNKPTPAQLEKEAERDAERIRRLEEERRKMAEERLLREEERRFCLEEEKKLREKEEQLKLQEEMLRLEREKLRQEQEALLREKEEHERQKKLLQPILSASIPATMSAIPKPNFSIADEDCVDSRVPLNQVQYQMPVPAMHEQKSSPIASPSKKLQQTSPRSPEVREEAIRQSKRPGLNLAPPFSDPQQLQSQPQKPQKQQHQQPQPVTAGPPVHEKKQPEQMSKRTLSALSATPKARLVEGEQWLQARRKPEPARQRDPNAYNQHWLIQEAEMRRISEQRDRLHRQGRVNSQTDPPTPPPVPHQRRPPPPPYPAPVHPEPGDDGESAKKSSPNPRTSNYKPHERREHFVEPYNVPSTLPKNNMPPAHPVNGIEGPGMLSVSGKKKCSHCAEELGRGAAMIIESLRLFYHIQCFKCCVCHIQLGNGLSGADVRVRNHKLHCHNCYSNDEAGLKFSKV